MCRSAPSLVTGQRTAASRMAVRPAHGLARGSACAWSHAAMGAWLPRFGSDPVLHGVLLLLGGLALALISRAVLRLGEQRLRRSTVVSPRVSITRTLFPATAAVC